MKAELLAPAFMRPWAGWRLAVLAVSLTVIGLCVAVFKTVGFGTAPGSTFSLGLSNRTGLFFGTCQLLFNLLLFLPVIRLGLSRIGVGTIGNMVGLGYIADFFMWLIERQMPPMGFSMTERVFLFGVSTVVFLTAAFFTWWWTWGLRLMTQFPS